MKVLVAVPAYNEAASLPLVVRELQQAGGFDELLVVDDGSTDGTRVLLQRLAIPHVSLGSNIGIAGAMRVAFRYAAARDVDVVVRMDADGQHDPGDIRALVDPIRRGVADVVRGSRYRSADGYRAVGVRRALQRGAAWLLSRLTGTDVTDPTSGFCAYGRRAIALLTTHTPSPYPEPELLLILHRHRLRTVEVAARMRERLGGRSSLGLARSSLALVTTLFSCALMPLRPQAMPEADR